MRDENRIQQIIKEREEAQKKAKAKVDFEQSGQIQQKLDVIAEYLGLKESDSNETE